MKPILFLTLTAIASPVLAQQRILKPEVPSTGTTTSTRPAPNAERPTPYAPSPLPVRRVTLFTSGVAYTERGGAVEGDAMVPLVFRTAQINDILKSMVLLDATGQVQPATYAAKDPIGRTLQSCAVDVTNNLPLEQLLNRFRGARMTVDTSKGALSGQLVGVEPRQVAGEDGKPVMVPFLNLLTENGLISLRLDAERNIKILDERLKNEFSEALGLLASGSDDQRRQVSLHFSGNGRREVRVGYVTEAPLWKMSYRLLLGGQRPGQPAAKPYLQGWAMVENTSDDDWKDIRLSLVSGRPVSFIQDLYQPLYIPRPVVASDVIATPFPQTHGGNLQAEERKLLGDVPVVGNLFGANARDMKAGVRVPQGPKGGGGLGGGGGRRAGAGLGAEPAPESIVGYDLDNSIIIKGDDETIRMLRAQATGSSAGELFQYNISAPVTLPRQQAAMIPVIAQDIETERVSLYNADVDPKFPLNAVRIKNNTGQHLKGGPVTLFDEGVYAGDAKMEDIPKGDNRLVSYAVDLSVEGERQGPGQSIHEVSLSLKRGVLIVKRQEKQETTYNFKSKADKSRTVLVEHPLNAPFTLVSPAKAAERTSAVYRFAVALPAGKTQALKVAMERLISENVVVMDIDLNGLAFYANRKDISEKLKQTLQEIVQRRRRVQELQAQAAAREGEIGAIMQDQERVRKNMSELDRTSALYKRYVDGLDQQETKIQNLRIDSARLRGEAAAADKELRVYLDGVVVE
jgi:hypothetical protein